MSCLFSWRVLRRNEAHLCCVGGHWGMKTAWFPSAELNARHDEREVVYDCGVDGRGGSRWRRSDAPRRPARQPPRQPPPSADVSQIHSTLRSFTRSTCTNCHMVSVDKQLDQLRSQIQTLIHLLGTLDYVVGRVEQIWAQTHSSSMNLSNELRPHDMLLGFSSPTSSSQDCSLFSHMKPKHVWDRWRVYLLSRVYMLLGTTS